MPEGGKGGIIPLAGREIGRDITEEVELNIALQSRIVLSIQVHRGREAWTVVDKALGYMAGALSPTSDDSATKQPHSFGLILLFGAPVSPAMM